jgi:hypothetical protein
MSGSFLSAIVFPLIFIDTTIGSCQPVQKKPTADSGAADIRHASGQTIAFPWNKQECKAKPQLFF